MCASHTQTQAHTAHGRASEWVPGSETIKNMFPETNEYRAVQCECARHGMEHSQWLETSHLIKKRHPTKRYNSSEVCTTNPLALAYTHTITNANALVFHRPNETSFSPDTKWYSEIYYTQGNGNNDELPDRIKCFVVEFSVHRLPTQTQTHTCKRTERAHTGIKTGILKWNTVNYVLCEIITGAIVCEPRKWLYFISSSSLPPTCQVVYICVKYYCNNNGNNLFMSFSWEYSFPPCLCLSLHLPSARLSSTDSFSRSLFSVFFFQRTIYKRFIPQNKLHIYSNFRSFSGPAIQRATAMI